MIDKDYVPPCQDPSNDPNDWFIEKDGKQYIDDVLVTEDDVIAHLDEVDPDGTRSVAIIQSTLESLTEETKRKALIRRRQARDKCHVDCYARLQCLDAALAGPELPAYGTWGGYHREQLAEIDRVRREKETDDS